MINVLPLNSKKKLINCRETPRKFFQVLSNTKKSIRLMPFIFIFSFRVWMVKNNSWKHLTNMANARDSVLKLADFVERKKTLNISIWLAIGHNLKLHLIHLLFNGRTLELVDWIDSVDKCLFTFSVSWSSVLVLPQSFIHTSLKNLLQRVLTLLTVVMLLFLKITQKLILPKKQLNNKAFGNVIAISNSQTLSLL